jgi:hypothetical protein
MFNILVILMDVTERAEPLCDELLVFLLVFNVMGGL